MALVIHDYRRSVSRLLNVATFFKNSSHFNCEGYYFEAEQDAPKREYIRFENNLTNNLTNNHDIIIIVLFILLIQY